MLSKDQLKIINTLISKFGLRANKGDLVAGFSAGRTESSRELTGGEAKELIKYLKTLESDEAKKEAAALERMRRNFFGIARDMRWCHQYPEPQRTKELSKAINTWCLKQKYKKRLNDLNKEELAKLLTIFKTRVLPDTILSSNKFD